MLLCTPTFVFCRGRYDIDMFLTHFRLRGKTYDYKILHSSVTRLFLLPKADEIHIQLVVRLSSALLICLQAIRKCCETMLTDHLFVL